MYVIDELEKAFGFVSYPGERGKCAYEIHPEENGFELYDYIKIENQNYYYTLYF